MEALLYLVSDQFTRCENDHNLLLFILTAGKISRRVSVVHYPDPKELEKVNLNSTRRSSSGTLMTTSSQYFPMQSGKARSSLSGHAASSHGSRPRSSVSEVGDPSPKRRRVSESENHSSQDLSSGRHAPELSRGHSSGISSASDQSHGGKSKKRYKHKE